MCSGVNLIINHLGLLISRLWHMMPESDARMSFEFIKAKLSHAILITGEIFSCLEYTPQADVLWSQSDYKPSWLID